MLLDQPVFDLKSWNTLKMAHLPRHDRILPDQGGCANEHIFHANQLAATCSMGKNVSRDYCLGDAKVEDGHPGQNLIGDPLPENGVIPPPATPVRSSITQMVEVKNTSGGWRRRCMRNWGFGRFLSNSLKALVSSRYIR